VHRDERRRELNRSPIALYRVLFRGGFDVTSERGYRLRGNGVEQGLNQELSFSDATGRGEAIEGWDVLFGVVLFFWIVRRVFYKFQITKEPSAVETGVSEEPCHLSKDFSFLKKRSIVTCFSPHMFQFNRELEGNGLKEIHTSRTQKYL